jgi:cobalamin synthase
LKPILINIRAVLLGAILREGMRIGPVGFWIIVAAFVLLTISCGNFAAQILIESSKAKSVTFSAVLSVSACSAVAVSSLFNIRKLYKDAFAGLGSGESIPLAHSATAVYYLTRPAFAAVIACLFSSIVYGCIRTFSEGHAGANGDFIFFSAISASILAVSTGDAVGKLEQISKSGHSFFRIPF